MINEIMTLPEVAEYLRINPATLYRHVKKGEIPGMKVFGTSWRFYRSEIDNWMIEKWNKASEETNNA